ncbi:MAG: hypothetical protein ABMA64_42270 [Myxococcota bacterium]
MTDMLTETDEALMIAAREHLARHRECQLLSALITQLRSKEFPWWAPTHLRGIWPTPTRFEWLDARPDVRGRLTHQLTGLAPITARHSDKAFQIQLIERVLEAGDVSDHDWEMAFHPEELAVHAPPAEVWHAFRSAFPWDRPSADDRELMSWLLAELLDEKKDGLKTSSIMTPLYVRSAIDVRVWQEHIPLDVRVQIDGRRLRKELEGKTFTCRDELAVVKLERIVEYVPTVHLRGVFDALERVLPALAGESEPTGEEEVERTEVGSRADLGDL